jgi:Domain of unknown function (DUF4124)
MSKENPVMIRNIVIAFSALVFGAGALPAAGQTMQKYVTPDGKTVYSDRPIPGARLVDQIAPPPPVDPKAAAAAQARAKENAERANASSTKRAEAGNTAQTQEDAAAALARAKEQLEKGKEPLPGERLGTAGGGSRLTDAYWARQRANEQAVKNAEARLNK